MKCQIMLQVKIRPNLYLNKCDALRDLVPFVQFQKRENTHAGMLL